MPFLSFNDLRMYYQDIGTGYPVVLVHGLGSDHTAWGGLIPLLKEDYRILAVDLRGHGKSSNPQGPYSIELFTHDIHQLLESLNIDQAHFLGHSMGGCVLQELALQHPGKIRSLTLISSFAQVTPSLRIILLKLLKTLNDNGYYAFFDYALKITYTPEFIEKNKEFFREIRDTMAETVSVPALKESINACLNVNLLKSLRRIRTPTLIIQGKADVFTPPIHAKQIKDVLVHSQIEIMDHVGHNLLVELPDKTYSVFKNFIKGI